MDTSLLVTLLARLPAIALWIVAGAFAVSRWNKHPTASLLLVSAGCIEVMTRLAWAVLPQLVLRDGGSTSMYGIFSLVGSVLDFVALGLLLFAVFAGRDDARTGAPGQSMLR